MSHFSRINEHGIVTQVIVAEQDVVDRFPDADSWVQTSYNTRGGIHTYEAPDGERIESDDQTKAFRKNYGYIGCKYDADRDAFIPPRPYTSWVLNEFSCLYEPPIEEPELSIEQMSIGCHYIWDEDVHQADNTQGWVMVGCSE